MVNTADYKTLQDILKLVSFYLHTLSAGRTEALVSTKLIPPLRRNINSEEARFLLSFLIEKEAPVEWRYTVEQPNGLQIYTAKADTAAYTVKFEPAGTGAGTQHTVEDGEDVKELLHQAGHGIIFHIAENGLPWTLQEISAHYAHLIRDAALTGGNSAALEKGITLVLFRPSADDLHFYDLSPTARPPHVSLSSR